MKCSVKECEKEAWQKGLCTMHYSRLRRHGDLEAARPEDWGARYKHPLYNAWRELVRKKDKSRGPEWDDFWVFVKDVGERPSPKHVLSRWRESEHFGPANFFWREKVFEKENGEEAKDFRRRYMQEYRQMHPERSKGYDLKKQFGIGSSEYAVMLEAQKGVCAICKQAETHKHQNGSVRSLAVDHCHGSGKIRGLLCGSCNTMIGQAKDDPVILRAAIEYLHLHKENVNEST